MEPERPRDEIWIAHISPDHLKLIETMMNVGERVVMPMRLTVLFFNVSPNERGISDCASVVPCAEPALFQ